MSTLPAPPRAFSGSRLGWGDLPRAVRERIARLAGAPVISETSATSGFSPGFASVLELADGTAVFVKAVSPEQNPDSPDLARAEIRAAAELPPAVDAPDLLWSDDDGTWVILALRAVEGRTPRTPWVPSELERVLAAVTALAEAGTPAPAGLPSLHDQVLPVGHGWARLLDDGPAVDRAAALAGPHADWLRVHLDALAATALSAPAAAVGSTLVHNDLRADNVLLDPEHDAVWLIDWVHAARDGARWYDLLTMLPSVAMQGGGDPEQIFWSHPNARGADDDAVRTVLTGLTGYLLEAATRPAPPGLRNLRAFQAAQGRAALDWLSRFRVPTADLATL